MLVMQGPELVVEIGFDPNWAGTGKPANLGSPNVHALIDTGAIASFIDDTLATTLQLPIVNQQVVSGSNGKHTINSYLAHIYIPALDITHSGQFGGVHLIAGGQRHSALIGRTLLRHFQLTYDGPSGLVEITLP
jgi:Aspartyl protease